MSDAAESIDLLREQLQKLEREVADKNQYVSRLEKANREMEGRLRESGENTQTTGEISELEETLRRMMMRMAMILQGSRCVFMTYDPKMDELTADTPALGIDETQLNTLRVKPGIGLSGECYSTGQPIILYDAQTDERARAEGLDKLGVHNGVCVPLIIEKRDEETNRVLDRRTIGVLHVFDKKYGNIFIQEDIQLLERLAKNAAAVINTAEIYKRVTKEKEELDQTIESLYAGLIMVNKTGRITQMNASARQIFGISESDLLGGKSYETVIKEERVRDILRAALMDEKGVAEQITLADSEDGGRERTFQIQSALVRNDVGDLMGTAAIFNDITALINVDKMKTAFVSTVSHELRTPLTAIKGFTATLLEDKEGTYYEHSDRLEFYGIIDKECDRLKRLIDDLLNVSKIESGTALQLNFTEFNFREQMQKVVTIATGSTYKRDNHTLKYELEADIPTMIEGDEDKIEQIFHNLIGNALKYSPDGGDVLVKGTMLPGGEMMQFAISDQGIGMNEAFLKIAGQRFARNDNSDTRAINGTGLGLYLVKNFVEAHGGKMWPHSDGPGKGSTFFFTLPTKQPDDQGGGNLAAAVSG